MTNRNIQCPQLNDLVVKRFSTTTFAVLLALAGILLAGSLTSLDAKKQPRKKVYNQKQDQSTASGANALVRRMVQHELQLADSDTTHWMFKLRKETPAGVQTRETIETSQGDVARTILINDKPLTPEQRATDDARLAKLLSSPEEQTKKRRQQKQDENQVRKMFKALPDAFIYEYADAGKTGPVKLNFKPNPNYQPTSRELQVYAAMQGTMLVEPVKLRLLKMDAEIVQEVKFGYGMLGHLDKGGKFLMEKSKVGNGDYVMTTLNLDFKGKILLFKTLDLKEDQALSDFKPVPAKLTLQQGVDMLKKGGDTQANSDQKNP